MQWIEISAIVGPDTVNQIAAVLGRYGQGGATVEESESESGPVRNQIVKIYLPNSRNHKSVRKEIEQGLTELPFPVQLQERKLKPQDWFESLKKDFKPMAIGRRMIIKPSWISRWQSALPEKDPDRIVIELDPGAAFGTGLHPTTRLCLAQLEKHLRPGMKVFDLGTGTGILAITAVKLGAAEVLALDIDPVAVRTARSNAEQNSVQDKIQVRRGSLSARAQRMHRREFDIALANISSQAISSLSKGLYNVLKPGGVLISSGIHTLGLDQVLISLALAGFKLQSIDQENEWHAVIAVANSK